MTVVAAASCAALALAALAVGVPAFAAEPPANGLQWRPQAVRGPLRAGTTSAIAPWTPTRAERAGPVALAAGEEVALWLDGASVVRVAVRGGVDVVRTVRLAPARGGAGGARVATPLVWQHPGVAWLVEPPGGGAVWVITAARATTIDATVAAFRPGRLVWDDARAALRAWIEQGGPRPVIPGPRGAAVDAALAAQEALARTLRGVWTPARLARWRRADVDRLLLAARTPAEPLTDLDPIGLPGAVVDVDGVAMTHVPAGWRGVVAVSGPALLRVVGRALVRASGAGDASLSLHGAGERREAHVAHDGPATRGRRDDDGRLDGARAAFPDPTPLTLADGTPLGARVELTLDVPAGRHEVEIASTGLTLLAASRLARRPTLRDVLAGDPTVGAPTDGVADPPARRAAWRAWRLASDAVSGILVAPPLEHALVAWRRASFDPDARERVRAAWRASRWRAVEVVGAGRDVAPAPSEWVTPTVDDDAGGRGLWALPAGATTIRVPRAPDGDVSRLARLDVWLGAGRAAGAPVSFAVDGVARSIRPRTPLERVELAVAPGAHVVSIDAGTQAWLGVPTAAGAPQRRRHRAWPVDVGTTFRVAGARVVRVELVTVPGPARTVRVIPDVGDAWDVALAAAPVSTSAVPVAGAPAIAAPVAFTAWLPPGVDTLAIEGASGLYAAVWTRGAAAAPAWDDPFDDDDDLDHALAEAATALAAVSGSAPAAPSAPLDEIASLSRTLATAETPSLRLRRAIALIAADATARARLDLRRVRAHPDASPVLAHAALALEHALDVRGDRRWLPPQPPGSPIRPGVVLAPADVGGAGDEVASTLDALETWTRWIEEGGRGDGAVLAWGLGRAMSAVAAHPLAWRAIRLGAAVTRTVPLAGAEGQAGSLSLRVAPEDAPSIAVERALTGVPWDAATAALLAPGQSTIARLEGPAEVVIEGACRQLDEAAAEPCTIRWGVDQAPRVDRSVAPGAPGPLVTTTLPAGIHELEIILVRGRPEARLLVRVARDRALEPLLAPARAFVATPSSPLVTTVLGPTALRVEARAVEADAPGEVTIDVVDAAGGALPTRSLTLRPGADLFAAARGTTRPLGVPSQTVVVLAAPGAHRVTIRASTPTALTIGRREPARGEVAPRVARLTPAPPTSSDPLASFPDVAIATPASSPGPAALTASVELAAGRDDMADLDADRPLGATRGELAMQLRTRATPSTWIFGELRGRAFTTLPPTGVARLLVDARRLAGGLALTGDGRVTLGDGGAGTGATWAGRLDTRLARPFGLGPRVDLTPALVLRLRRDGQGAPGRALDPQLSSAYAADHPTTLAGRVATTWRPLADQRGVVAIEGRANGDGSLDQVGGELGWLGRVELPALLAPIAQLTTRPTLLVADDDRLHTRWRTDVAGELAWSRWFGRGTRARLALAADVAFLEAQSPVASVRLVLRVDATRGRGLVDLRPAEEPLVDHVEGRRWSVP